MHNTHEPRTERKLQLAKADAKLIDSCVTVLCRAQAAATTRLDTAILAGDGREAAKLEVTCDHIADELVRASALSVRAAEAVLAAQATVPVHPTR